MRLFKKHLRWKLLLLLALLLFGVSFTLTIQHIITYKAFLYKTFEDQKTLLKDNKLLRSQSYTESLASQLENELASYNFSKFTDLVQNSISEHHQLKCICVLDNSGRVVVRAPSDFNVSTAPLAKLHAPSATTQTIETLHMLTLTKTLYMGTEAWGTLTLNFSQSDVDQKVARYAQQMEKDIHHALFISFLAMAILFLLFLPIAYIVSRHISQPIMELTARALELSKGNFSVRSSEEKNRQDELGVLERTFDQMSQNLAHSYTQLAEYNTQLEDMVQARTQELEKLSITDHLTLLYNRVKLEEVFDEQIQRAKRYNTPFAVLLCDIDYFKNVNDTFGHLIGDKILVEIAEILRSTIRNTDIAGRWGGEEFLIIAPETDEHHALLLAERLRAAIEEGTYTTHQSQTISIGVSCFSPKDSDVSLIGRADKALYAAKNNGRNRVEFHPSQSKE
jgi:diguanylate cyclase (GGDEF)-like protein